MHPPPPPPPSEGAAFRPLSWLLPVPTPCGASGGVGVGAFVLFWLFSAGYSLLPPPSLSLAPGREPPPREFPGRPSGLPPWEPGQPVSSQAPWSSQAAPPPPTPAAAWVLSPVRAWLPGRGGAPLGRFFGSGLCARCRQRGRLRSAEPSPGAWAADRRHRRPLAVGVGTPGRLGPWRRLAHGGRAAPSRRGRRSCWNRCAGWTRPASEPAGTTSMGSCAA